MHSRFLLAMLCFVALSGCGSASTPTGGGTTPTVAATASATPPAATGLTAIDWANTTYPNACNLGGDKITVVNGMAKGSNGVTLRVTDPMFGYITRTDQVDVIVPYECTGATGSGIHILVFAGTAAQPTLVGQLPLTTAKYALASVFTEGIIDHKLELSGVGFSSTSVPLCCPDTTIIDTYAWNGNAFTLSSQQATALGKQLAP
ncbi:MAG: hypothetical protein H0X24_08545 [Ktedonobacterales bacterium]|nr:hypothetical protein [Ktedonobacterales bacterium]